MRLGPKRPPIAAHAIARDGVVQIDGRVVTDATTDWAPPPDVLTVPTAERWQAVRVPGPPTTTNVRAFPLAERTMLREGRSPQQGSTRGRAASTSAWPRRASRRSRPRRAAA